MSLLALLACGTAPTLTSVDPPRAMPGTELKVLGDGFTGATTLWLVRGEDVIPVRDLDVRGAMLITTTVPELPGTWTVQVQNGRALATLPDGLEILEAAKEEPCSGRWKANSQVSKAREVVIIDRFAGKDERDTHRIPFSEVAQIEYELVKLDADALCSVVYVRRRDGTRVPFDDDTRLNLGPRAFKLGNVIGKPTVTTRSDVEEDPRPVEQD